MGTPEYMSPEQCHGDALDFRSDVYSLGIVLYEIFTGRVPFRGETLMATLLKQVQDEVPLATPETARLPARVVAALRKALAKDPAQRYATAAEVAEALREARSDPAPEPAAAGAGAPPGPAAPTEPVTPSTERRRDTRLPISLDVLLQRSTAGGAVLQEERTIADNVGRHGVRVLTTMTAINPGDTVHVRQVDGDFQSRSAVRHVHVGSDRFRKLGLEFLDRVAPDHLVPSDGSQPRIPHGVPKAPPLTPAPAPIEERRKDSRLAISVDVLLRRLTPGGSLLQEERTVLDNIARHGARVLSSIIGFGVGEIVSVQEVGSDFQTRAEVRSVQLGADKIQRLGLRFLDRATPERLLPDGDSKPRLSPVASPTPVPQPLPVAAPEPEFPPTQAERVVLAEAMARNPDGRRRAEELLLALTRESPACLEAFLALSTFYQEDGLKERAAAQLRKALEFQPGHPEVIARLRALD